MEFIQGLLWGSGISLGICVGLVTWVFLREATYGLLGIAPDRGADRQMSLEMLAALEERNRLTGETNYILNQISIWVEKRDQ